MSHFVCTKVLLQISCPYRSPLAYCCDLCPHQKIKLPQQTPVRDTITRRVFTSLAMENVFDISLVQQCQMLEANLGTCVLASCLSDPDNAPDIVRSNKRHILNSDFKMLLSSANHHCGSAAAAAQIANHTSWHRLWDIALDCGVKGT